MKANSPGVMADSNGNKILMNVIKKMMLWNMGLKVINTIKSKKKF